MAITRAQQVKELLPGLHGLFGLEYKRYADQWKSIFQINSSDRSFEEETKLAGFGLAPTKTEGGGIYYDTAQEAWTARYTHETIAMGFAITEEAVEDNLYESLSSRYTKAMARSFAYTKNVKGAAVLNRAFNASFVGGDGVQLCSVSHPLTGGGVQANTPSVVVDMNETSIEAAAIAISKWVDEKNLLIAAKTKKLVIATDNQFVATRLLETQLRSSVQGSAATFAPNDVNAMYNNGTFPEGWDVNNFLTTAKSWYIITDIPDGLKYFERVKLTTKDEGDFDTGNLRFKGRERYSFGWSDPYAVYACPGT